MDKNIKILCVEDEHFITELYTRALVKAGYDVTSAADGNEGLTAALTDHYDLILLDLMIPGITGFEVLDKIKAANPPIHSRIVITTNLDQDDENREKVEKLADGYIIKAEITPKQLVEIIGTMKFE